MCFYFSVYLIQVFSTHSVIKLTKISIFLFAGFFLLLCWYIKIVFKAINIFGESSFIIQVPIYIYCKDNQRIITVTRIILVH